MIVRFLGTGSAIDTASLRSCVLFEPEHGAPLLLDAAPECSSLLRCHGRAPQELQAVLLTHLHGDHVLGLPLLLAEFTTQPNDHPLRIIGPAATERVTRLLLENVLSDPVDAILARASATFESAAPTEAPPFRVTPIAAKHGDIEAFGYRLEAEGMTIVCTGDTELTPAIEAAVLEADVAILNVTTRDLALPGHMNLREATALASRCGETQTLFAIHRGFTIDEAEARKSRLRFPRDGEIEDGRTAARPSST